MLNVSTFGNTADIYAIVHLVPHACQHVNAVATPVPGFNPVRLFLLGIVKDAVFVPPLPANLQIFATVSPLLWHLSTVIC